jgi:hypothetical protein
MKHLKSFGLGDVDTIYQLVERENTNIKIIQ